MTLDHFEELVKEYQPNFRLRDKAYSDIVGLFLGDHYIGYRLNRGELHLDSFILPMIIIVNCLGVVGVVY